MGNKTGTARPEPPAPMVVLGTVNRDHVVVVARQPLPGETVLGDSYGFGTGGKGSNQAVAAAIAGVAPLFVSAVGDDSAGRELLADLEDKGVDVSHVARLEGHPSGVALITVSREGENSIVVAAGAGAMMSPAWTAATVAGLVRSGSILLTQLELPLPVVVAACRSAEAAGARVALNLSPSREIPEEILAIADPLVVNAGEAGALAGEPLGSPDDAARVASALAARCRSVVITLGERGAVIADSTGSQYFPAMKVPVVDTTGAGDSFAGTLAAALVRGGTLSEATQEGIAASAATVQHHGAQPPARPSLA